MTTVKKYTKKEVLQSHEDFADFELITEYYYSKAKTELKDLNSLRRVFYRDIPTQAISELRIIKNTTFVTEEEILQSLAFVLIKDDRCKLKGDEYTSIFKLSVKGPKLVTTEDLLISDNITLLDLGAPLFHIDSGELKLIATATKGTGMQHAAFFPVNTVTINIEDPTYYKLIVESSGKRSVDDIYKEAISLLQ